MDFTVLPTECRKHCKMVLHIKLVDLINNLQDKKDTFEDVFYRIP